MQWIPSKHLQTDTASTVSVTELMTPPGSPGPASLALPATAQEMRERLLDSRKTDPRLADNTRHRDWGLAYNMAQSL